MTKNKISFVNLTKFNQQYRKKFLSILNKTIDNSSYIKGINNVNFEKAICKIFKCKYALAVNSGTDALIIGLKSLNLKKNDEVIMTSNTWISAAYAIVLNGAKPIFVDINDQNFQMDIESFERKITKKTKACIVTHLYGFPNQMDKILKICKKNKIKIVEDLAQSHLAEFQKKLVGNFGELSTLSFYPSKNLGALGDGGAIITNNKKIYSSCKVFANYGSIDFRDPDHREIGINSRMDELQAAFLIEKLKNLKRDTGERIKIARKYDAYCDKLNIKRIESKKNFKNVYHIYPIIIKNRDKIKKELEKIGIFTQIHYKVPIHQQKAFKYLNYKKNSLPITEKISKKILSLPFYVGIKNDEIKKIFSSIKKIIE